MIEINESAIGPKCAPQFIARDHFALLLQQCDQEQKRLALQPDSRAFLSEFARAQIDFKNAEANRARG